MKNIKTMLDDINSTTMEFDYLDYTEMKYFDNVLSIFTPTSIATMVIKGDFRTTDDYFMIKDNTLYSIDKFEYNKLLLEHRDQIIQSYQELESLSDYLTKVFEDN